MEIKNIKKPQLNLDSLHGGILEKAYEEGVYADTPANRKLGRVGMSYKEWTQKQNKEKKEFNKEEKIDKNEKTIKVDYSLVDKFPSDIQKRIKNEFSHIEGLLKEGKKSESGFIFDSKTLKSPSSTKGSIDLSGMRFPGSDNKFFKEGVNFLQMMKNSDQKNYKNLEDLVINGEKISKEDVEFLKEALFDAGRNSASFGDPGSVGVWGPISLIFNKCEINKAEGGPIVKKMKSYISEGKKYQKELYKKEDEVYPENSKKLKEFLNKGGKKTYNLDGGEYEVLSVTPKSFYIHGKDKYGNNVSYTANKEDIQHLVQKFYKEGIISSEDFNIVNTKEKSKYPWKEE